MKLLLVALFVAVASADPAWLYSSHVPTYNYMYNTPYMYNMPYTYGIPMPKVEKMDEMKEEEGEKKIEAPITYTVPLTYTHQMPHVYTPYYMPATPVKVEAKPVPVVAKTLANDFVKPEMYAAKGQYHAENAGAVHIAKREAEADPALLYSTYGYRYPTTYSTYTHGYRYASPYYNYHYTPSVYRHWSPYAWY